MTNKTELSIEQVASIIEDWFHRHGDHNAKATLCDFGSAFFTVRHQLPVRLPGDTKQPLVTHRGQHGKS